MRRARFAIQNNITKMARFQRVRRVYSWIEHCRQQMVRKTNSPKCVEDSALFPGLASSRVVAELHENGIATGLQLQPAITNELRAYSLASRCFESGDIENAITLEEASKSNGSVQRALVCNPEGCSAVRQIVADPKLGNIAREYLGYTPNHVQATLIWNFPSTQDYRYDAATYHYDTHWFNSVQILFYLTEVDRSSGPHSIILKSHRTKPLSMKLRSSLGTSDSDLLAYFGCDAELIIEGSAGTGFMEDPSCFHKIIHPTTSNRLALRVVYL